MGMDTEPETDAPAPPGDRHDSRDPRTGNRHEEWPAPDESSYPLGTDGFPVPTLWARREGDTVVACCPACGGSHAYEVVPGAPIGAADGYVEAPCRDIESIGGAMIVEWQLEY